MTGKIFHDFIYEQIHGNRKEVRSETVNSKGEIQDPGGQGVGVGI